MKQFFKFFFASVLGVIVGSIVLFFLILFIAGTLLSGMENKKVFKAEANSVLELNFNYPITERTSKDVLGSIDFSDFSANMNPGLNDLLKCIRYAADDEHIKGIYLHSSNVVAGMSMTEEIRNALLKFKKSGKFIIAYADEYSQSGYYLSSVADKVYLNPAGIIDFRGLGANLMFIKGTLEKAGIEPQLIRHGKYKSAGEPFVLEKMSPENYTQVKTLVDTLWNTMVDRISMSRNLPADTLKEIAANMKVRIAEQALEYKLVDQLMYEDEVHNELKKLCAIEENKKLALVSQKKYMHAEDPIQKTFSRDKIAVIYAVGAISSGKGNEESIGSESLAKAIRKAREDEKVKAIVMRVNSPGGSALASDVILREVMLAKKAKPFYVSMSDVAASGGYYISCLADTILVQPNTITGSIGVFGILFNAKKLLNEKLGITTDKYLTGPFADLGSMDRPVNESERKAIEFMINDIYKDFIGHVSKGRSIDKAMVDSLGQGRVWTGKDAISVGLADMAGGLEDAIQLAQNRTGLDQIRIVEYPEQKDPFDQLINDLSGNARTYFLKKDLGVLYDSFIKVEQQMILPGIHCRMPYDLIIH
ncbi:MAG TPA: signal peptide peptidase SppA [Bacteroidia bacterium]|nr:signal peptide peptidase SppA [Bacteroidia bacterium]